MTKELREMLGQYKALCRTQMDTYAFNASRAWRSGDSATAARTARLFQAWDTRHRYCQRLLEAMEVEGVKVE